MRAGRIRRWTVLVYGALSLVAIAFASWRGRPWLVAHPSPWFELTLPWAIFASLAGGLGLAGVTLWFSRAVVARFAWGKRLHAGFREVLGDLDGPSIAIVAIASSIGEELFFRGALQPSLGLAITSVVFGLVHIGPDRRFLVWTPWALAMGALLGVLYEATGSLWGCIVAHGLINYENLHFIVAHDPRRDPGDEQRPRLVGRAERR